MSEFSSALYLDGPLAEGVALLDRAGISGAVLPAGGACALLVPWDGYAAILPLARRLWQLDFAGDHGLWVREYRDGEQVLFLDFSALWPQQAEEEDTESGGDPDHWPDGQPKAALAARQSQDSIRRAVQKGVLSAAQAQSLLAFFQREPGADPPLELADAVPALLGFTRLPRLAPEHLDDPEALLSDWPGAVLRP